MNQINNIFKREVLFEKRKTWYNLVKSCKKDFLYQSIDVEAELRELMKHNKEFMYYNQEQMKW